MVKVEPDAPARWRKPPETATPSTLDKRVTPHLDRVNSNPSTPSPKQTLRTCLEVPITG